MDGFKLYVTNTSNIPPDGYLCYEDPFPGGFPKFPNITQTIPCNQLGKYVVYYDDKGSDEGNRIPGPIVELCYVAIKGCAMSYWGINCDNYCPENCLGQHCFIGTGSCVWGCNAENCFGNNCNRDTSICTEGCKKNRTGLYCNKYNMATESLVSQYPNGSEPVNKANDGYKISCSRTQGHNVKFQVDLKKESIVTGIYITLGGCPPSQYGPVCDQKCPENCHGPCDLETGLCIFGCLHGWTGDECKNACKSGKYGRDCQQTCSPNCLSPTCNRVTGECIGGCNDGWQGFNCSQKCPNSQFGRNCSEICEGCISKLCDHVDGLCDDKTVCEPGYVIGEYCNKPCEEWYFGNNCSMKCNCLDLPCNTFDGLCSPEGCKEGYHGKSCDQECNRGFFGRNCETYCKGCVLNICDSMNGLCYNNTDCKSGFILENYCNNST
ncbi:cell death abnormality protein 1-like [Mytilus edulis]|uniref:cell death abnormality protein 1-like n=1 Tax=Mytilus edulis TaxID=6550 RepID=UPI0039EE0E93